MATLQKITTANRTAARRLLNNWIDSRKVRLMPLAQLGVELHKAIREGLTTIEGANRALSKQSEQSNDYDAGSGGGKNDKSDDDRDRQSNDKGGSGSDGDSGGDDGEGSGDGDDDSDADGDDGDDGDEMSEQSDDDAPPTDDGESESDDAKDDDEYATDDGEEIRHEMLDVIKKYVTANIPVMLVGPTGCGKSFMAEQVAGELGMNYYTTGSVFAKYDLIGYVNQVTDKYHGTPAFDAHTKGGLYCQDEMDASNAAALVSFNALNDKQSTYAWPCGTMQKHADYRAIGTANTWGAGATADYVGRNKLDGATVNRFVRVYVDYDKRVERRVGSKDICERVWSIRAACEVLGIKHILSTRSIDYATVSREAGVTKACIDRDILFAALDDDTVKQIKAQMRKQGA